MRIALWALALGLGTLACGEEKVDSEAEKCANARQDGPPGSCSALADCPRLDCVCKSGTIVTSRACQGGTCAAQPELCLASCADKEGWACVDPSPDGGA